MSKNGEKDQKPSKPKNASAKRVKSTASTRSKVSAPKKKSTAGKSSPQKVQRISFLRRIRPFLIKLFIVCLLLFAGWLLYLDATIRDTFEGQRWDIPARVYARPLELFEGAALNADLLEIELKGLGYHATRNISKPGSYHRLGGKYTIHSRGFQFSDGDEFARKLSLHIKNDVVTSLKSDDGRPANSARLDPMHIGGIYPAHHEDRVLVDQSKIPELLPKALVAIEDKEFWEHFGISIKGIVRALWVNVSSGELTQGGSTLTQQLVKNFYLDSRRTLGRKAKEAIMAMLLDWHYEKPEILEAYFNEVYLGQSGKRAIHGFGLASQFYFARPLKQLEPHQIALLVAMVKGPTYYNPRRNPERALARRNLVLRELAKEGLVAPSVAEIYQKRSLDISQKPVFSENLYPAFMDLVRRQLREDYRQEDLETKGLQIFTTIDPQVQNRTERVMKDSMPNIGKLSSELEAAAVVTGLESGEVKALVGGRQARFAGFNRVLDAKRQIGSLVKPAVYLTALTLHDKYALSTRIDDKEISLTMANGEVWEPRNFENKVFGKVPLHQALSHSMNLATANLGFDVGIEQVIDTLETLGIKESLPLYPSLFLGAVALTPYEVVQMYQTIAASGFNVPVRAIREITDADGKPVQRFPYQIEQVVDSRDIHLLQYAMQETMREGTGKSAYRRLPDALSTAGKTGTTNDSRDSWFAGMTGDYLGVFWVGRDDNGTTELTGASGAMRLWADVNRALPQRPFSPLIPEGVEYHWVSDERSVRTDAGCSGARSLPFVTGTEPTHYEPCRSGLQRIKGWFQKIFE